MSLLTELVVEATDEDTSLRSCNMIKMNRRTETVYDVKREMQ